MKDLGQGLFARLVAAARVRSEACASVLKPECLWKLARGVVVVDVLGGVSLGKVFGRSAGRTEAWPSSTMQLSEDSGTQTRCPRTGQRHFG